MALYCDALVVIGTVARDPESIKIAYVTSTAHLYKQPTMHSSYAIIY